MLLARPVVAVVFDMDGVLLDTERLYTEATQAIVGRFGKTFDWSVKGNMIGRPALDSARYLVGALELPITPRGLPARSARSLFETLMPTAAAAARGARAGDGAARARRPARRRHQLGPSSLRAQDAATTATGSPRFDVVVTGDDPRIARGKPAPDIYLLAAAAAGRAAGSVRRGRGCPGRGRRGPRRGHAGDGGARSRLDRDRLRRPTLVARLARRARARRPDPYRLRIRRGCLGGPPRGIACGTVPVPEDVELTFPNDGGCFGCSPANPAGLRCAFGGAASASTSATPIADRFHGAPGVAHGGIVATMLDEVSCAAIAFVADRRVMTGELTVRYERPCPIEAPLDIGGERSPIGRTRATGWSRPRSTHDGERLARSTGKFFLRDDRPSRPERGDHHARTARRECASSSWDSGSPDRRPAAMLADWGAEVVKIEPPDGDPFRGLYLTAAGAEVPANPPFELDNRGKRSVALDLRTRRGARDRAHAGRARRRLHHQHAPRGAGAARARLGDTVGAQPAARLRARHRLRRARSRRAIGRRTTSAPSGRAPASPPR